jgi:L,D-transpeptidase catalytic domain/Putative peptidoglycan binding domain
MNGRLLLAIPLALVALAPAAAQAQTPPAPAPPAPPPAPVPVPAPAAGKASISVSNGLATKRMRYAAPFQQLVVSGRVKPYVAGESVVLQVVHRNKLTKRIRVRVGRKGSYRMKVKLAKNGLFRLFVKHQASAGQKQFRTRNQRVTVVDWQAGQGQKGTKVLLLQRGLKQVGFSVPVTGYYDALTSNAVTAFRKSNGMGNDGYAIKSVYAKVLRGQGAFRLRHPKAGKHVEFDWSRQVVVLADKGKPYRTYHASSGKPSTPTVFGTYRFYLKTPGTNAKGMVDSNYFIRGYAIHGYPSVPNFPASHGCVRVPIPNAAAIFRWIDIGNQIFLYR